MASDYDLALQALRADIQHLSPRAAILLDNMQEQTDSRITYLAAFILTCLQAQRDHYQGIPPKMLTADNLKESSFFEVAKDDRTTLDLFNSLLSVYQQEANTRNVDT